MSAIAVIGAGVAGLACARRLSDAACDVTIFDKGRSVGGRLATRRVETAAGSAQFDHGAQYITIRDMAFRDALEAVGAPLAPWLQDAEGLVQTVEDHGVDRQRLVGVPGMSALAKALANGLNVRVSTRIDALERSKRGWILTTEAGAQLGPFTAVVVATPAEQAPALVRPHSKSLADEAEAAVTAPCWAGLFAYAQPSPTPQAVYRLKDHPILAWAAHDSGKPGRASALQCWVVHARSDWTAKHLEQTPEVAAQILRHALEALVPFSADPVVAQAHRWRYAQVAQPAATPFAWDASLRLGLCGDWRIGPRVEAAWLSGDHLAQAILA
jgi:predicted NAD/FAD-dependent oxidoreductase